MQTTPPFYTTAREAATIGWRAVQSIPRAVQGPILRTSPAFVAGPDAGSDPSTAGFNAPLAPNA